METSTKPRAKTNGRARTNGHRKPQSFDDLKTEHLKCRTLTHPWEPMQTYLVTIDRRRAYETLLECSRCGTTRTDHIFITGDREVAKHPRYGYVDGYLIEDLPSWGGYYEFRRNARVELYGRFLVAKGK